MALYHEHNNRAIIINTNNSNNTSLIVRHRAACVPALDVAVVDTDHVRERELQRAAAAREAGVAILARHVGLSRQELTSLGTEGSSHAIAEGDDGLDVVRAQLVDVGGRLLVGQYLVRPTAEGRQRRQRRSFGLGGETQHHQRENDRAAEEPHHGG